jgi:glutathione peroxidase
MAQSCLVFGIAGILAIFGALPAFAGEGKSTMPPILQLKMPSIDGKTVDFSKYKGKVILIVNVASECGYTPQYKGLQALHTKYAKYGLAILGIPSNDFGGQEPGTNAQVAEFCKKNFAVTFDLFAKVGVAEGKNQCELFKILTSKNTNPNHPGPVLWNFEKFLLGRDGTIVARFPSDADPDSEDFEKTLLKYLKK